MTASIPSAELSTGTPLQQFYFRALISFAAAGTLAAHMGLQTVDPLYIGVILTLLTYTAISYRFANRRQDARINRWLAYIDAGLIGVVISLTHFSLLPTILFLVMVQFNALLSGGMRRWIQDNIACAAGIMLSMLFHTPEWVFSSSVQISAASLVGISAYFLIYAVYMHQRIHQLNGAKEALEEQEKWHKIRAYKLSRYLPPPVWKAVTKGDESTLQTERKKITVFFSDIKDFSELSEEMEAEALTELLNHYLTEMSKIVTQFGGTIDKFMGDGMMVLFGDGPSQGVKSDCVRCLSMAITMRKRMRSLQQEWHNQGIKRPLQVRMGINTGYCTIGTFGTTSHLNYTALGTHVNLGSRLESAAEPNEILISHETWSLVKDVVMCRDKGEIRVKGFSHPIKVYQVADFRRDLGSSKSYMEEHTEGFSMYLDLEKIRNYDKTKVMQALRQAAEQIKDKVH
ncbi:adenylate/guanylate cyclase domain-containing protein [Marinimicrobium alkaliphilum]|uniref:adenylate/guanylate cyclase domain-containing protein n=1 Tax=Marinimicrobium alkaliphilum TaxID=2202654 RepID=UPI000DBA0282|nr:adenylate/guanylate cyclase domain-containing protein [Marinimicrobium alkaliphilum]